jgi:hypothetical protein
MAGTYIDIYAFSPPVAAEPGSKIDVSCYVHNIYSGGIYVTTQCYINLNEITMSPGYAGIDPGAAAKFTGSFTMPTSDVTITIRAWYWSGTEWIFDDEEIKVVKATVASEFDNLRISSYTPVVYEGQYCDVICRFEHRGEAESKVLYAAIGNSGFFGFDEILHASRTVYATASSTWQTYVFTVRILITSQISAGLYDLYAKLDGMLTDPIKDVIKVESSEPVFSNLSATYRVVG